MVSRVLQSRACETVSDTQLEQKRKDVFKWISTIQYREHHRALSKELLPDSGEWLFESHEFTEWERSDKSSIFWLHGVGECAKLLPREACMQY